MKEKQKTNCVLTIILILGTVTVFFPLYMAVIIAFKKPSEMTNDVAGALSFPKQWSFENFRQAMEVTDFWHSLGNSLLITLVTIVPVSYTHLTYCFDSKPEKECFLQYISSKKVKEIYFTGMFTANQGDLFVQYYDPESKRIRQYYPDFLAKMNDGSYQLIEVKGDNMIDDEVVKAKAEAAEEMSVASGMKYVMYAGSVLMKQNVLEHPPVTYSDEPSPLLMVAEDPVPYGK